MNDDFAAKLRAADAGTVTKVRWDGGPELLEVPVVDLLEFFNRMLDTLGVPDADRHVYNPEADD
jgi:hypothetical protein